MRSGGQILIDGLAGHGVDHVFSVPGESFLPALDALHDKHGIRLVVCRHEGGAAMMAEAMGKLRGEPGVAFVTRGPGAMNAAHGVMIAAEDETPMLLLVGLPPQDHEGRGAFQEIDLRGVFGALAKSVEIARDVRRLPELVARALHLARSGTPGPAVLGLPEDVLKATAEVADAAPLLRAEPAPADDDVRRLGELLASAERPLVIAGGPGWTAEARAGLEAFAARADIPLIASFRRQDYIDNRHTSFVGHAGIAIEPKLAAAIRSADLLIVIGAPLGEIATGGYRLVVPPTPAQTLVHVRPDAASLGRVYRPALGIVSASAAFVRALAAVPVPSPAPWSALRRDLRRAYEAWSMPLERPGAVNLGHCMRAASELLPESCIVTSGAGNYTAFLHRHFTFKGFRTQLAPASGSMGYGLPAAIAAKMGYPDRTVVAFAGDGCFMMTAMELATAVQYALPLVVVVADNGMYGTIRMHQERSFPGRVVGTSLVNPDFAELARSFGAHGEWVRTTAEFAPALRRALAAEGPAVISLALDPEQITPQDTIATLRAGPRSR